MDNVQNIKTIFLTLFSGLATPLLGFETPLLSLSAEDISSGIECQERTLSRPSPSPLLREIAQDEYGASKEAEIGEDPLVCYPEFEKSPFLENFPEEELGGCSMPNSNSSWLQSLSQNESNNFVTETEGLEQPSLEYYLSLPEINNFGDTDQEETIMTYGDLARARRRAHHAANKDKIKIQKAAYREANRDRIKEQKAAYWAANRDRLRKQRTTYQAANREVVRKQLAAYYTVNRDRIKEQRAAYRAANRERVREQAAAYRIANRDKIREQKAAHQAAKRKRKLAEAHENTNRCI